jgi:hypothetical protein
MPNIINPNPAPTDPLTAGVQNAITQINAQYRQLFQLLNGLSRFVWNNPKYTPQEVVAAFGTYAANLFQLSGLLCQLIGAVTGQTPNPIPTGWTWSAATDGTVTLTAPTPAPAPSTTAPVVKEPAKPVPPVKK